MYVFMNVSIDVSMNTLVPYVFSTTFISVYYVFIYVENLLVSVSCNSNSEWSLYYKSETLKRHNQAKTSFLFSLLYMSIINPRLSWGWS